MKKNYYAKVLALTVAASMVSVPAFAEEGDGTAVAASVKNADTSLASEEEGKGTEVTIDKGEYADLVDITASVVDSQAVSYTHLSEQIRRMIKVSDGDSFEEMRSLEQELTFLQAEQAFQKYHVPFSEEKYNALGIRSVADNLYTNLALILSDQCTHTIKVAVFNNGENTEFRDSREFGGSVFKQLDDTFAYLNLCNKTTATIKQLERVESVDYPEEALREALLNAIVHRDYGFSGSIIINVNDDKMEFISMGGLVMGLSTEDIRSGISQPRNKKPVSYTHLDVYKRQATPMSICF